MTAWLSMVILALILASVADRSGTAWLAVRGLGFAGGLALGWPRRRELWPAAGFGLAAVAVFGWRGLDLALAALVFALRPLQLRNFAVLAAGFGVVGAFSFLYSLWESGWQPAFLPFHNRNHYAVFCELTLPVLVYVGRQSGNTAYFWLAGWMVLVALAGGSRAGTLLILAEVLALWSLVGGVRRQIWLAGPAVVAAGAFFVLTSAGERLKNPLAGDHRLEIWRSGIDMVTARPFLGWGAGEFPRIYPEFAFFDNGQFVNAAHNDWLEWATEFGLPLTFGFAILLFRWLRKTLHFYPAWGILVGALHAAVDYSFHLPGLLVFAAALAGSFDHHGKSLKTQSPAFERRDTGVPPP